ncbi:MAG: type V CRISPR-associated protein Cas12a/Cpf1 [Clostridioides sp.]|nr:type V CRISPR-associated protein Cas12a/Cpf1 [Clostridioides sp.]
MESKNRFEKLYSIPKTLRFELKPIGKTLENFINMDINARDSYKAEIKKDVQRLIDDKYKIIIDEVLEDFSFGELRLKEYEDNLGEKDKIKKINEELKKTVVSQFTDKNLKITYLNGKDEKSEQLIKVLTSAAVLSIIANDEKIPEIDRTKVKEFDKFSTYFTNFFDIRKHILEPNNINNSSGSVCHRVVEDNLKIYANNIKILKKIAEESDFYQNIDKTDKIKRKSSEVKDMIQKINKITDFNNYISQRGISVYNEILGGVAESSSRKIQGLNEIINLYNQNNNPHRKLPKLNPLYKMILSDVETGSFKFETIEEDKDLIKLIKSYLDKVIVKEELDFSKFDLEKIYIKEKNLSYLSNQVTGNWRAVREYLENQYDGKNTDILKKATTNTKKETYEKNRISYIEKDLYTIGRLNSIDLTYKKDNDGNSIYKSIEEYLTKIYHEKVYSFLDKKSKFREVNWDLVNNIKQDNKSQIIKELLDSAKDIQHLFSMFEIVDETNQKDVEFYQFMDEQDRYFGINLNAIYNQSRNFLTKKPYKTNKYKLNFDNPTLANGWDSNKEIDNSCFLLKNGRGYYLGVWEKTMKSKDKTVECGDGNYEKMTMDFFNGANKMLPKIFFSKKFLSKNTVSKEFMNKYKAKIHCKGENFDKKYMHELINYFKDNLKIYEKNGSDKTYQEIFNYRFSDTKSYDSIDQFYREVESQSYKVKFDKVSNIDQLVKDGKLYLFQIWSKDFSIYSKGTKNLNTIYFESLFSKENLKEVVYKLSGQAELFYRPKSVYYSEEKMKKGHHSEDLKDKFNYPIIKDRRYTEDKFFFHCPIEINFTNENLSPKKLNELVNENMDDFDHIIGIDRGERHLIYLVVIDKQGNIKEQVSMNKIMSMYSNGNQEVKKETDYLEKLKGKADSRDNQRKSWEEIETIKELKEGYISQVVNQIRIWQEKYNAVVILENLNYGFKNSRIKVEQQVYQKFELALIKKFNYIIDKKNTTTYNHGKQLTNPISTLDEIGSQSGIIYYIPAWNTSKIDPTTGFVNLIYGKWTSYKNVELTKKFITQMDDIRYNEEEKYFEFDVDFSKFEDRYNNSRMKWTICSYGDRIKTFRNKDLNNQWDNKRLNLTNEFKKLFGGTKISKEIILEHTDKEFYKEFLTLFKLMLQMRNSITGSTKSEDDYLISPVKNNEGKFFDSRDKGKNYPENADANGAFNIARKGLQLITKIQNHEKNLKISNEEYLKYLQK